MLSFHGVKLLTIAQVLFLVRGFVGLEQAMVTFIHLVITRDKLTLLKVAVERVKEFSELDREPAEFIEPRPDRSWPSNGHIKCEDLAIRYSVCIAIQSRMILIDHILLSRNFPTFCTTFHSRCSLVKRSALLRKIPQL